MNGRDHMEARVLVVQAVLATEELSIVRPKYVREHAVRRRISKDEWELVCSSITMMGAWLDATELPSRSGKLNHAQKIARAKLWKIRLKVLAQHGCPQGTDIKRICRALDMMVSEFGLIEEWPG